jgi:AraC-like DNA-binding protein
MAKLKDEPPRGVLNLKLAEKKFRLSLYLPSPDLSVFIEHYWIVKWDLRGQEPHLQENLPYPCVHLVFEKGNSRIFGVITGKFSYLLKDEGRVFGIKFKPGAFYPFVKTPVSTFTDSSISLEEVFGVDSATLEKTMLSLKSDEEMVEFAENFLREKMPEPDKSIEVISQIVACIIADREITKVEDLVKRLEVNKRTLQRIFSQYVGVSPKWVIKRYRLHEATEQLAGGEVVSWPKLALELGYFDQAHFIKDFKTSVGKTPADYLKKIELNS